MLDEEDYRHVAPAMPVTDLPTSAKTITVYRRRDIGSVLKGIKTYAAAARSAKDRRRLAREVRAVADQIDGSHDARWLHDAFDLLEAVCDALVPLRADIQLYLDMPDRPIRVRGDHEALAHAIHDLAAGQAAHAQCLWISVRSDRHAAKITITGNGQVDRVSTLARLVIARAEGRILPLGEDLAVLLPLGGAAR